MNRISQQHIATALTKVNGLSLKEKEGLADGLFVAQPNLLASVLALSMSNVSMKDIEVALNILLVCFEAVRASGLTIPMISEEVQDLCLARIVARASFADGLPAVLQTKALRDQIDAHGEKYLLALVLAELKLNGLHTVRTEQEKRVVLTALNIAETISYVATRSQ